MAIFQATGLAKYFGAQDIFAGLSFEINHGDKIALIGPNGTGKTTLLRIMCGLEAPTEGTISSSKGLQIGYLPQKPTFPSEQTLYGEMLTIFANLQDQRAELRRMEQAMGEGSAPDEFLERYGKALERFELAGGYEYEHRIQRVLGGLGFGREEYDKPIALLSGGQKTRALLAKLLLQEPGLLLLDEPTNHLDLAATEWLEKYLASWAGSLLVVAHDRYFLDKIVSRVWDMSFGQMSEYRGNYTAYTRQRAERLTRQWKEYQEQQEFIAKTAEFVRRFKAGQLAKQARGRETRLERLERVERPQEQKAMRMSLQARFRSGNEVLRIKRLTVGYRNEAGASHPLFSAADLLLLRLQRVALLGPNGSGKTTFFKTILEQLPPLEGEVRLGASIKLGYLAQSYEDLNPENTILDEIWAVKQLDLEPARSFLGRFLFSGDDVFKPISALSGGERGRVALAKLALRGANFLLLDEPTSHLDIESREILEEVLRDYDGTILFVSHDRYFMDALATHVWSIEDGALRAYEGNYTAYVAQREMMAQQEALTSQQEPDPKQAERDQIRAEQQRLARQRREQAQVAAELEARITALEDRLRALESEIGAASAAQEVDRIRELGLAYATAEQELHDKLASWAELEHV